MAEDGALNIPLTEEDELFLMANLHPKETGLPMTVWASPKGDARHDARIKVSAASGGRMQLQGAPVVAIRPEPHLIHGRMDADDLAKVIAWISLNEAILIDYWNESATTTDLVLGLRKLES